MLKHNLRLRDSGNEVPDRMKYVLIIPDGCVGLPTLACLQQGIPVIAVRENKNLMKNDLDMLPWSRGQLHIVDNYWEAAGVMTALKAGIDPTAVRRPLSPATVQSSSAYRPTGVEALVSQLSAF